MLSDGRPSEAIARREDDVVDCAGLGRDGLEESVVVVLEALGLGKVNDMTRHAGALVGMRSLKALYGIVDSGPLGAGDGYASALG